MPDRKEINKRGYLKEDFRLFHLKDSRAQKVDYHYHAFDKLILLLGGKVTYVVEGVTYFLQPWDLLLVGHDLIHRPIIDPAEPYERVVIWLGREWLERRSDPGEALDTCFDTTRERGFHLLRFDAERRLHYMQRIQQLEEALRDRSFGAARMADTLCQQMLIDVNRDVLRSRTAQEERDSYRVDPKMEEVLRYILDHLGEELTVENVRPQKRLHPRCGTSFLLLVMVITILIYACLGWNDSIWMRIGTRLITLPIIAGISYEVV